jgi:hypothetical protein
MVFINFYPFKNDLLFMRMFKLMPIMFKNLINFIDM